MVMRSFMRAEEAVSRTFMVMEIWWVPLFEGRNSHLDVSPSLPKIPMASGIDTFLKLGWKMVRLTNCCLRWLRFRSACTQPQAVTTELVMALCMSLNVKPLP